MEDLLLKILITIIFIIIVIFFLWSNQEIIVATTDIFLPLILIIFWPLILGIILLVLGGKIYSIKTGFILFLFSFIVNVVWLIIFIIRNKRH